MVKKVVFTRDDLELLLLAVHDKIEWCKNKADYHDYYKEYEDRDYMKDTEQEYKELQEVLVNELRGD